MTKSRAKTTPHIGRRQPWHRVYRVHLVSGGVVLLLLIAFGWWFADRNWPYRYRNVKPLLENVFASQVTVEHYHRIYFPSPGFVATGVTLRRKSDDPGLPPLATAKNLVVQGGWISLLTLQKRVDIVDVEGLHMSVPAIGSRERQEDFPAGSSAGFGGPVTAIGKLVLRDGQLDIQREDGPALEFPVYKLILHNMQKGQPLRFDLDMQNAMPSGHILSSGTLGPIVPNDPGKSRVSGTFTFEQVQLSDIGSLRGVLKATGDFQNTLNSIEVRAQTNTPLFAVGHGRPLPVTSDVQCTVNALTGDIALERVALRLASTPVLIKGLISGDPKKSDLQIDVARGRVEDLLGPFEQNRPPVTGQVALRAKAQILPGSRGASFLSRLQVQGGFDVPSERLTNAQEEKSLSGLSERAQNGTALKQKQEDAANPPDVLSSLTGSATIRNGVVRSDKLEFAVAGARADFRGTFDLRNDQAHFDGTLFLDSDVSHVATGFKSILLKPLDPFFKRKDAGAVVPIAITGGPGSYKVTSNLMHTK
jgi:hypothetical protein